MRNRLKALAIAPVENPDVKKRGPVRPATTAHPTEQAAAQLRAAAREGQYRAPEHHVTRPPEWQAQTG
ncbi:hypothetical protein TPY_1380 [Sulfobacillus acidophilus TPY]|nr:hypothetical protein TPY_1380 [Sulfobacillus acidophilus TPY]